MSFPKFALLAAVAAVSFGSLAKADLTHRYSFDDGTPDDSVGGVNGTLVGTTGGGATISGGMLNLNNPDFSGPGATENYMNLPGSVIPSSGSATLEGWFSSPGSGFFTELFSATNSNSDANPPGANTGQYFMGVISAPQPATPPGGAGTGGSHIAESAAGYAGGEVDAYEETPGVGAAGGGYLDNGDTYFYAAVIDGNANTLTYYLYDQTTGLGGPQETITGIPLSDFSFTNLYLGRSAFTTDNATSGTINEFRIYNNAQSAAAIAADYAVGPDVVLPVPEPMSMGLLALGSVGLLARRRRTN
jgi:hypothetical protein